MSVQTVGTTVGTAGPMGRIRRGYGFGRGSGRAPGGSGSGSAGAAASVTVSSETPVDGRKAKPATSGELTPTTPMTAVKPMTPMTPMTPVKPVVGGGLLAEPNHLTGGEPAHVVGRERPKSRAAGGPQAVVGDPQAIPGGEPRPAATAPAASAPRHGGTVSRAVRTHFGTVAGVGILGLLLWRLGTGVFLDGLRRIDGPTLAAALLVGAVTTVFSAWRWQLVARGLNIRLPLGAATADYYRALFLNAALPGGVLGDVHRAVRHGQSAGDVGRGVRAVVLERAAGQIALTVTGVTVLLTLPSPVLVETRHFAPLALFAAAGAFAVVTAVRMNRAPSRRGKVLRRTLAEARECLFSRRNGPGVALSSAVVLAGHIAMFVVAARVVGVHASALVLLPLAILALVAMGVPLNVGGFGPREGATAWAFAAAGLGEGDGLSVAVVYGVLSFAASLPGALVLIARWYTGLRADGGRNPGNSMTDGSGSEPATADPEATQVSNSTYAPKDSARLASNAFPFSAEPREGRPMTPDSV